MNKPNQGGLMKKVVKYSDTQGILWLRENGYVLFGRITIKGNRHQVWFNPKLIRKDRVKAHFKKEMTNENQSK